MNPLVGVFACLVFFVFYILFWRKNPDSGKTIDVTAIGALLNQEYDDSVLVASPLAIAFNSFSLNNTNSTSNTNSTVNHLYILKTSGSGMDCYNVIGGGNSTNSTNGTTNGTETFGTKCWHVNGYNYGSSDISIFENNVFYHDAEVGGLKYVEDRGNSAFSRSTTISVSAANEHRIYGHQMYVANGEFSIYNISNPGTPSRLVTLSPCPVYRVDADVASNQVFLGCVAFPKGIRIYERSGSSLTYKGNAVAQNFDLTSFRAKGNSIYDCYPTEGIKYFDISNPKVPELKGTFGAKGCKKLEIAGNRLLVAGTHGFYVYSISGSVPVLLFQGSPQDGGYHDVAVDEANEVGYVVSPVKVYSFVYGNKVKKEILTTKCFGIAADSPSVCSGHGTCDNNACVCFEKYYGNSCNVTQCFGITSTNSSSCGSHGTCIFSDMCQCGSGYFGSKCDIKFRICPKDYFDISKNCSLTWCNGIYSNDSKVCSSHGSCTKPNTCVCSKGYSGSNCQNSLKIVATAKTSYNLYKNITSIAFGKGESSKTHLYALTKFSWITNKVFCYDVSNTSATKKSLCDWESVNVPTDTNHPGISLYSNYFYVQNTNTSKLEYFEDKGSKVVHHNSSVTTDMNGGYERKAMEEYGLMVVADGSFNIYKAINNSPKGFFKVYSVKHCNVKRVEFVTANVSETSYAFAGCESIGIRIYKLTMANGVGPFITHFQGTAAGSEYRDGRIVATKDRIYHCNGENIQVFDISYNNVHSPKTLTTIHEKCKEMKLLGQYLYVVGNKFTIFDTNMSQDPPTMRAVFQSKEVADFVDFDVFENTTYVATHDKLYVYDTSHPESKYSCYGVPANAEAVCSGRGKCISQDTCSCNGTTHIGKKCDICPARKYGDKCELTDCFGILQNLSASCSVHGSCVSTDKCVCNPRYFGRNCSVTECFGTLQNESSVCSSHGNCVATDICQCTNTNFTGPQCNLTYCFGEIQNSTDACGSHGTCVGLDTCQCKKHYTGLKCDIPFCYGIVSNVSESCGTHGSCVAVDICQCTNTNYTGPQCNLTYCYGHLQNSTDVCGGHGICEGLDTCQCKTHYTGLKCDITFCYGIVSNVSASCGTHGSCIQHDICSCENNYYGSKCDVTKCQGFYSNASKVCSGHGNCNKFDICRCKAGFYGPSCNITKCGQFYSNETFKICGGLGNCTTASDSCDCDRSSGSLGKYCDEKIDPSTPPSVDGLSSIFLPLKIPLDYTQKYSIDFSKCDASMFLTPLTITSVFGGEVPGCKWIYSRRRKVESGTTSGVKVFLKTTYPIMQNKQSYVIQVKSVSNNTEMQPYNFTIGGLGVDKKDEPKKSKDDTEATVNAIVGGVIGGVVFIGLLLACFAVIVVLVIMFVVPAIITAQAKKKKDSGEVPVSLEKEEEGEVVADKKTGDVTLEMEEIPVESSDSSTDTDTDSSQKEEEEDETSKMGEEEDEVKE